MVNKKGVSEIISYVLLIIIAVSISGLVYSYLYKFVPKGEVSECPDGISLIIQDATCSSQGEISLTLSNRGLWNISAVSIKIGKVGSKVKGPLSSETNPYVFDSPLSPSALVSLPVFKINSLDQNELELIPIIYDSKEKQVICSKAIIDQPITCK